MPINRRCIACIVSLNRLYSHRIQATGHRIQQRNSNSNSDSATATATATAMQAHNSNSDSDTPQLYSYGHTAYAKSQKNGDADLDLAPPPIVQHRFPYRGSLPVPPYNPNTMGI